MINKSLINVLKQLGLEYFISLGKKEIYSKNFRTIIKNKIDNNLFKFNNKYYQKSSKKLKLDNFKYRIKYLFDVTKFINIIITLKNDRLTGLRTREDLENYLLYLNKKSIFVLCDLDDFKNINDTYGHQVGDKVLQLFGKLVKENISIKDYAARYGGEEFLIIFDGNDIKRTKRIITKINRRLIKKTKKMHVSFSAGITLYNNDKKINDVIRKVDLALYYVKKNGKNGYCEYNETFEKLFLKNN